MKKLFYLFVFLGFFTVTHAQTTTTIYATGASGSYICGSSTSTVRTDGVLTFRVGTTAAYRGYAVFDLSTLPVGALIQSVTIGYNLSAAAAAGGTCSTYGYAGDLSTVTVPGTLFANMVSGTLLNSTNYGTAAGSYTLPTNATTQTFVASHIGSKISICFTQTGAPTYYFRGETALSSTTGNHAPFLTITYCSGITGLSATATPNPVCPGGTLHLTGGGTGGASFHWYGPGPYTSTNKIDSVVGIPLTGGGIYTFVTVDASGCNDTATTTPVTFLPSPAAITGFTSPICPNAFDTLHDASGAGTWTVSPTTVATITPTGILEATSLTGGTGTVTFTLSSTGCTITRPFSINVLPAPITGIVSPLCSFVDDTLHDPSGPGTWSVSPSTVAGISYDSVLDGNSYTYGTATVSFTLTSTGCTITAPVTINPMPAPITGGPANDTLCIGQSVALSDTSAGGTGTWASAVPMYATVTSTGVVTSVATGTTIIEYTNPITGCGPQKYTLTVGVTPSIITGISHICTGATDTLTDSIAGGVWLSSAPIIGTVSTFAGWLTGYTAGNVVITYKLPDGCFKTFPVLVTSAPGPILNMATSCPGLTDTVTDTMQLGIWTSSNTGVATITPVDSFRATITSLTAGVTTISYSSCGYLTTSTFTVNPIPKPIMGKNHVCIGDTVILHDSTNMGIWVSKDTALASAAAAFGIITGIKYGMDTVIYKLPTGCQTGMQFHIDSLPARITGITSICPHTTTTLSDATGPGKWRSRDTLIATVDSNLGIVKGLMAGLDTIVYRDTHGCRAFEPITINPLPAPIVGDTTICATDSMMMTDVTPGGHWYSSNPGVFYMKDSTGKLMTVDTSKDSAYVIYILPTGCSDSLKLLKHNVHHPHIYYNGVNGEDSVENNFLTYQWYDSTTVGPIPGAVSNYCAILYNETYFVVVKDTFGCVGRSTSHISTAAGVNEINNATNIVVYPNPVSSSIHILSSSVYNSIITDLEGRVVLKQDKATSIDVSKLVPAEYIINLLDDKGVLVKTSKFTKE